MSMVSQSPTFIPIKSIEMVSVVDANLNHVVSLASLSDEKLKPSRLLTLESVLAFPGFANAFQFYFENNSLEGIPSSLFGPVVIQLQPSDSVASLLYLERSIGSGFLYTIVLKKFQVKQGLPVFSNENIDCIHFANKDQIRAHFNRVQPTIPVVSSLLSLANAIFVINHHHDAGVMQFLDNKAHEVIEYRQQQIENPVGLLLAPFGRSEDGKDFSIEPEADEDEVLSGIWKDDFVDLLVNFRTYAPLLLEYVAKKENESSNYYVNESIGPIRLKFISEELAIGLFFYIRSNSSNGYEFWIGTVPIQGGSKNPTFDYNGIQVRKKRMSSQDILDVFPSIDSLDLLLPLFLQVYSGTHSHRALRKTIQEIIAECRRNHPRETRQALQELAKYHQCYVGDLLANCTEEEIQVALYESIQKGSEYRQVVEAMKPFRHLGDTTDILFPGSKQEFEQIRQERLRAVREAEYNRRKKVINQKKPLVPRQ